MSPNARRNTSPSTLSSCESSLSLFAPRSANRSCLTLLPLDSDSTLLFQYAYYSRLHRRSSSTGLLASSSSLHTSSPLASPRVSSRPPYKRHPTRSHNSYDELSHAASAVARAAEALASSRGRRSRSRPKGSQRKLSVKSMEDGADETDNLMASVNSLASDATGSSSKAGRRTSTHQLKESLSSSQLASSKSSTGGPPSPSDVRGRPLSRPTTSIHPPPPMGAAVSRSPETNRSTTGGPSTERRSMSRKRTKSGTLAGGRGKEATAGLVLLSLVAVVGLRGMSAGRETRAVSSYPTEGRVLVSSSVSSTSSLDEIVPPSFDPPSPLTHPVRLSSTANANGTHPDRPTRPPHHPSTPPPTWQRAIGRVSAWTCTVLYLTSRMPQIWKNVRSALNPRHSCPSCQTQRPLTPSFPFAPPLPPINPKTSSRESQSRASRSCCL